MAGTYASTVQTALNEVRRIKAPTKRAQRVAALILELATQAEVEAFTYQLRLDARVQDPTLLPHTTWLVRESGTKHGTGTEYGTATLQNTLMGAEDISIDWPSVNFHWGIIVSFTWGGISYLAHSADYQITETWMST